jgi:hypothetical protein
MHRDPSRTVGRWLAARQSSPGGSRAGSVRWSRRARPLRRSSTGVLVLVGMLALLLVMAPAALAQTPPGQPGQTGQPAQPGDTGKTPSQCDQISNQVLRNICKAGTNPVGAAGGAIGQAAGNVAASAGDSALRSFTNAVASAGQWFLGKVGTLINTTTSPNVIDGGWFASQYRIMLALAMIIALPFLLVSVAQSVVRADGMQAIRSAFVYLPIAAIGSFVGPAIAQLLINASDWMSSAVGHNAAANADKFMHDAGGWLGALGAGTVNPVAPVFGVLLAAIIVVVGAISIWLELLLRDAAIYIAVLFLPIGFAAMVWPAGWRWCKRLIEFLIAIIFAKVFIVAIINLAAAGMARGGLADKFEGVLAGGALLLMAAFTPIALLKLIPLAEAAVVTAGHQRAALRQATSGATAFTGSSMVTQMIQSRFRANAGGATGSGASWGSPATAAVAAGAAAVSAARNRAESGFAAFGPANAGGAAKPSGDGVPSSSGGATGATGGAATRPLKVGELAREGTSPDA